LDAALAKLNALSGRAGYIAHHYCPADDEHARPDRERMFYTQENGRRIDAMREEIDRWQRDGLLSETELSVLLAPLIFQAAYVSNTSGVFKGWHRGWGGSTKTAWYRIRSRLTLERPVFYDNGLANRVLCGDTGEIANEVPCSIAYLDPPYNQHQYGANYHLLNTVALWDKPKIAAHHGLGGRRDKAAIRTDWRTARRSLYCYRGTAAGAFAALLEKIRARWILVSYSTDGIMPIEELIELLARRGRLDVVTSRYKRYRVSSQRPSSRGHTTEFVLIVKTGRPGPADEARAVLGRIRGNERA
jgi:adenine-specific DNA-methyltransferase